jgi:hypothetical protein
MWVPYDLVFGRDWETSLQAIDPQPERFDHHIRAMQFALKRDPVGCPLLSYVSPLHPPHPSTGVRWRWTARPGCGVYLRWWRGGQGTVVEAAAVEPSSKVNDAENGKPPEGQRSGTAIPIGWKVTRLP